MKRWFHTAVAWASVCMLVSLAGCIPGRTEVISRDMLWTEIDGESRLTFVRAPKHYIRVRSRELRVLLQVLGKRRVSAQFRVTRAWGDSRIRGYLVVGVEGRRMHLLENIESHAMQDDPDPFSEWGPEITDQ